ncbi:unnamed protein product [Closterium sp. Yama58-4]|nr:unnamed protein product [Closterium sp. Yama58-4]
MTQTLFSPCASGYHTSSILANGTRLSKSIQSPFGTWQAHAGPGHPLSRNLTKLDDRLGSRLGSGRISRFGAQQQGWRRGFGGEGVGEEGGAFRGRRRTITAIGFTADPRPSAGKAAARLLRDAAALLLYQDAFKGAAPQAFLRLLLQLRRADGGEGEGSGEERGCGAEVWGWVEWACCGGGVECWGVGEVLGCGGGVGVWGRCWDVGEVLGCGGGVGMWGRCWDVGEVLGCGGGVGMWGRCWGVGEALSGCGLWP